MNFADAIRRCPLILAEGAVIERLSRDGGVRLDPHVSNAALLYEDAGRAALEHIYRGYLDIGRDADLPMIVLTPTWRANPERLRAAGFGDEQDVNAAGVRLLAAIRDEYGEYAGNVHIGGLMGCRGDAYRPQEALSEEQAAEFHCWQAAKLAAAGAEFLMAATLPAASEACGLAAAMAETGLPYLVGVVVRASGELLDGTPLGDLVRRIDETIDPSPTGYMGNCVHPRIFAEALDRQMQTAPHLAERVLGMQGNASTMRPEELDGLNHVEADDPESFADALANLHERFGLRILGGCCGTDSRHIRCTADRLRRFGAS